MDVVGTLDEKKSLLFLLAAYLFFDCAKSLQGHKSFLPEAPTSQSYLSFRDKRQ